MMRMRTGFLVLSMAVVLMFAGILTASRSTREDLFRALGNLAEVVNLVETDYVEELDPDALSVALDAGIVESVDRWAAVVPAQRVEEYQRIVTSPPAFGLLLAKRFSSAAVRATLAGSPARAAGLEDWELIELVDGVNTRGRPLWELRLELLESFEAGRSIELTMVDRQVDERRTVTIAPSPWTAEPAVVEDHDGVAVVHVESLPTGGAAALARLLVRDRLQVLDLRDLVWGFEDEAVAAADLFVGEGVLATWTGRRAGEASFEASSETVIASLPIVVVGGDTEGVGEVFAAALQRAGATVVGASPSLGHAPHMQFVNDGDVTLWIPVGLWLRPDGEPINGTGVTPDELVETAPAEDNSDPVLERAIELAREPAALEQAA